MDSAKRRGGRPRKYDGGRNFYEGELHALLIAVLPARFVRFGRLDVSALAGEIGYSPFTIYRWLLEDRVTVEGAKGLLRVDPDEERLSKVKLLPFLFA